ncbi:MAG: PD-(D/E)XK nuclease-like domain-containing protein [Gammaproteobacteria bacterium]|nr:PD-(D/E)XK nuclease-like domain-containing protein [Gammaproteobacteria bacterium]
MSDHSDYDALPGITATAIKAGATSMAHMRLAVTGARPEPTDAMLRGSLLHLAILEPGRLATDVAAYEGRRAGLAWEGWRDAHAGQLLVRPGDLDTATAVAAAVRRHPDASRLLAGCAYEHVQQWTGDGYGQAKARLDAYAAGRVVDLKTTGRLGAVDRALIRDGYHLQLGWYCHGAAALTGALHDAFIVWAETVPPHDVLVTQLGYDLLEYGEREAVRLATEYRACERAGVWPGRDGGAGVRVVGLPPWLGDVELQGADDADQEGAG